MTLSLCPMAFDSIMAENLLRFLAMIRSLISGEHLFCHKAEVEAPRTIITDSSKLHQAKVCIEWINLN